MNRESTRQAPGGQGERGSGATRHHHGRDIHRSSHPHENTWAVSQNSDTRAPQSDGTRSQASVASLLGLGLPAGATVPRQASLPTAPQPAAQLLQARAPRSSLDAAVLNQMTAIPQLRSMAGVPTPSPSGAPAVSLLGQALDGLAPRNPAGMALPPGSLLPTAPPSVTRLLQANATNASLDSLLPSKPIVVSSHPSSPPAASLFGKALDGLSPSDPASMLVPPGIPLRTAPGSVTQLLEANAPNGSFGALFPNRPSAVPSQPSLTGLPNAPQERPTTSSLQASLLAELEAISLMQQAAGPSPHLPHQPAARSLRESIIERLAAPPNNVPSHPSLAEILNAAQGRSPTSSLQASLLGQPAQSLQESIIKKLDAARNDQMPHLPAVQPASAMQASALQNTWSDQQPLASQNLSSDSDANTRGQDELLVRLIKDVVDADQPSASSLSQGQAGLAGQPHSPPSTQSMPSQRNADLIRYMIVSQAPASLPAIARDQSRAGLLQQMLVLQVPSFLPATARDQSQLPPSPTNVDLLRQMLVSGAPTSLPVTARDQSQLLQRLTQKNSMKDQLISLLLARQSSAPPSLSQASLQGAGGVSSEPISGERHNEEVRSHESGGEGNTLTRRQNKDERWMARYEELKRFKQEHGHCNVPHGWSEDRRLSWWVMNQRAQYQLMRRGRESWMSDERVALLDEIGFCWTPTARPGKSRDG